MTEAAQLRTTEGRHLAESRLAWTLLAAVLVGALVIGARPQHRPTLAQRVHAVAETLRCPTCHGLSVADSPAAASQAIRDEIHQRVQQGQSADEIRAVFVSRYGRWILLDPPSSGLGAIVWVLPVAGVVLAVAGLGSRFRQWRRQPNRPPTDAERALVDRALRAGEQASRASGSTHQAAPPPAADLRCRHGSDAGVQQGVANVERRVTES